jgi:periplasmic protein TonB
VRWDSPIVLISGGTAAIHTILIVFIDAMIVTHPVEIKPPPPRIEMFEVKVEPPPVLKPAAAPVQAKTEPPIKDAAKPPPQKAPPQVVKQTAPPPETPTNTEPSGGDPVVQMPDIAPVGKGSPVAVGRRPNTGHVGRGGSGGGTGSGAGSGSGEAPAPPPVSVATIKKRALPKGDYGYIDAGKDYPQEARQLGIEGPIRVRLVVDANGKVAAAVLLNRLGHGLDELALARAKKIEFEPARDTDDKAVTSVVVWTFNMTLPK